MTLDGMMMMCDFGWDDDGVILDGMMMMMCHFGWDDDSVILDGMMMMV